MRQQAGPAAPGRGRVLRLSAGGQGWRLRSGAGFSLVEALVAMLVVALGMLALAALLQAATRYAKGAELRATAVLLASDIADRLRANPAGAAIGPGGYDLVDPAFPGAPVVARVACSGAAPCGPADLARADLAGWNARVRATLPRGSARLRLHRGVAPAPDVVDVWVGWADPLTRAPDGAPDVSGIDCPASWQAAEPSVRCVHLQVAP